MIKKAFLKKQIIKTKKDKKTSIFLRRLIFFIVDKSLKKYYKDTFSMKCLQSSVAIRMLLEIYEIQSKEYMGAMCVSQVFHDDFQPPNWDGFWDKEHHVFLSTENGELVDLTIHYLHLHPMSKENEQLQVPAVWWEDTGEYARILKYIPFGAINIQLSNEDMLDLKKFKNFVLKEHERILQNYTVDEIVFSDILHGVKSLNELHKTGNNNWLNKSYIFEKLDIQVPEWIKNKDNELKLKYLATKVT